MARRNTRHEIIRVSTRLFLDEGFSATSAPRLAKELGISTGNLTFHFPTKEDLLVVLVEELCAFQWKMMEYAVEEGASSLLARCLETTAIAAICEEDEKSRDFYISSYSHPKTLAIIRENDTLKSKQVFAEFCPDWTDERYREAEILVSGIEFATLMKPDNDNNLDLRVAGALEAIMMLYHVPENVQKEKIQKVLAMDYRAIGRRILKEFHEYIIEVNNAEENA